MVTYDDAGCVWKVIVNLKPFHSFVKYFPFLYTLYLKECLPNTTADSLSAVCTTTTFGSLEGEESRGCKEGKERGLMRVEGMVTPSPCLDVLKIK